MANALAMDVWKRLTFHPANMSILDGRGGIGLECRKNNPGKQAAWRMLLQPTSGITSSFVVRAESPGEAMTALKNHS